MDSQSAFLFDTQSNLVLADQSRTREPDVLQPALAQTAVARTHPRPLSGRFSICASVNQESTISRCLLAILPRCFECVNHSQLVTALVVFDMTSAMV